jgi:hypothetical protein
LFLETVLLSSEAMARNKMRWEKEAKMHTAFDENI